MHKALGSIPSIKNKPSGPGTEWRQEGQKFKVIFTYIKILRPALAT